MYARGDRSPISGFHSMARKRGTGAGCRGCRSGARAKSRGPSLMDGGRGGRAVGGGFWVRDDGGAPVAGFEVFSCTLVIPGLSLIKNGVNQNRLTH